MLSFTPSLGVFLGASVLIGQIQFAKAECSNFEYLTSAIDVSSGATPEYQQQIDFLSCPSSLNQSCQFVRKEYTFTLQTQINVSTTQYFPTFSGYNESYVDRTRLDSYVLDTSTYSSDAKSIFKVVAEYNQGPFGRLLGNDSWAVETPLTIVVDTHNTRQNWSERGPPYVDLTVPSGYSATLYYNPFMFFTWGRFSACDNATLDGYPIHTVMPYFWRNDSNVTIWPGEYATEHTWLNDSVVAATKKSVGWSLRSKTSWSMVSVALGILECILL